MCRGTQSRSGNCRHSVNTAIPTICPVLPRQYIQGPNKTAMRRGGCRTGAKASWLGVLSPSLRGKTSSPLGLKTCCPFHKSSAWKCGVKLADRNFSWESFDESSARILCEVNPAPRTSEPFDELSARILCGVLPHSPENGGKSRFLTEHARTGTRCSSPGG